MICQNFMKYILWTWMTNDRSTFNLLKADKMTNICRQHFEIWFFIRKFQYFFLRFHWILESIWQRVITDSANELAPNRFHHIIKVCIAGYLCGEATKPVVLPYMTLWWDTMTCTNQPMSSWWLQMPWPQTGASSSATTMLTQLWLQSHRNYITWYTHHIRAIQWTLFRRAWEQFHIQVENYGMICLFT